MRVATLHLRCPRLATHASRASSLARSHAISRWPASLDPLQGPPKHTATPQQANAQPGGTRDTQGLHRSPCTERCWAKTATAALYRQAWHEQMSGWSSPCLSHASHLRSTSCRQQPCSQAPAVRVQMLVDGWAGLMGRGQGGGRAPLLSAVKRACAALVLCTQHVHQVLLCIPAHTLCARVRARTHTWHPRSSRCRGSHHRSL
jgi:hypothetical protein